jgi:hypothetical protein
MPNKQLEYFSLYHSCETDTEWETSFLFLEEIPILSGTIEESQALTHLNPHSRLRPYFITYKIKSRYIYFTYYFKKTNRLTLKIPTKMITINTPLVYNLDNRLGNFPI